MISCQRAHPPWVRDRKPLTFGAEDVVKIHITNRKGIVQLADTEQLQR